MMLSTTSPTGLAFQTTRFLALALATLVENSPFQHRLFLFFAVSVNVTKILETRVAIWIAEATSAQFQSLQRGISTSATSILFLLAFIWLS